MSPPPTRAVTGPSQSHFFGYFDKSPWDGSDGSLVTHAVDFDDRMPTADAAAEIRLVQDGSGETALIGRTTAWNFQKGSMLQWLPPDYDRLAFHDTEDGSFVTRIVDPETGAERTLPRPVNAVTSDGTTGFGVDVVRLSQTRPVCGYALPEPPSGPLEHAPADEGVHAVDMETGDVELLLSLAECATDNPFGSDPEATHWFNHFRAAPSGDRVAITQRWKPLEGDEPRTDRLLVVDGETGAFSTVTGGERVGHPVWLSDDEIVARTHEESKGLGWYRYDLSDGSVVPFATESIGPGRGHLAFSPDGAWGVIDTYPDADRRIHLRLYEVATDSVVELGSFFAPPVEDRLWRCDLHPRWNRAGTAVCFDSRHEGRRQLYVLDVSEYTA